tara:strand:+ start:284 stop:493 length:210 start_codon:yes stop_codon:yes gene_type:complete
MKLIILITSLIFLTNCSSNSVVKLGKKCTKIASDNTYEKSFIWIVDKKNIGDFNTKINKENCKINGEKS